MDKTKKENVEKKEPEKVSKKHSKKTWIVLGICGVCFLAIGGTAGYFLGQSFFASQDAIDYSQYSADELEDNHEDLMRRYNEASPSTYLTKFKSYEFANIALDKVGLHENVMSQTYGLVNAMGVKQTVRATSIKNENKYFLENISASSMVQAAKRFYQEGDQVITYNGGSVSTDKATWSEQAQSTLSKKEHEDKWGKNLSRPSIYIISKATTLSTSKVEKDGDGYKVSIDIDPKLGVLRYVKQMIEISGVSSPKFHSIHMEMTLDSDLSLIQTKINEKYSVVMVVKAESDAEMTEYFTYDQGKTIPDLNTNCDYSRGE